MTALDQYTRLESVGVWKENPSSTATEVLVSFGDSTLLLSDFNELPLAHWAMAAISVISNENGRTTYTPDVDGSETLEIDDKPMIEAIAQVSFATNTTRRKRLPFVRSVLSLVAFGIFVSGVIFGPDVLRQQARGMANEAVAYRLGLRMLDTMDLRICSQARANSARDTIVSKVFPDSNATVIIIENLSNRSIFPTVYPGNILILSETTLFAMQTPEQFGRTLENMVVSNEGGNVLERLFEKSTLSDTVSFLSTGVLPNELLSIAAAEEINYTSQGYIDTEAPRSPPLLRDQDWVALQNICLD